MMRTSSAVNNILRRRFTSYADRSERSISGGRPRPCSIRLRATSGRTPWYSARRRNSLQSSAERSQFAMRSIRSGASSAPANAHRNSNTNLSFILTSKRAPILQSSRRFDDSVNQFSSRVPQRSEIRTSSAENQRQLKKERKHH